MSALRSPLALGLVLLASAIAYAHADALVGMKAMWDGTPMYSFGYIVPFVSAYLVWTRREALVGIAPRPAWTAGGVTLAAALALLIAGHAGGILVAEQLAFVVSLVAVVLLVWGLATLRVVWMALAYLLLIVPFWDAFTEPLHLPFQQLSANLGIQMLHAVGVPAYREGVFLHLPNITLEVARACSGVNYLIAVLALGLPLAYLYLRGNGRRILLIASAIVVAALSNSLRVAMIGVLTYYEIGSPLHGPFHVLHGLFVSGIGYVVLFAGLRVLGHDSAPPGGGGTPAPAATVSAAGDLRRAFVRSLALAGVFFLVGVGPMRHEVTPVSTAGQLATLPDRIGGWTAQPWDEGSTVAWWVNPDEEVRRTYRSRDGVAVQVAIAYFGRQAQGREVTSHRTAPLHRAALPSVQLGDGDDRPVNPLRLSGGGAGPRIGYFWYDIAGRTFASPYHAKAQTLWNTVIRRRSDGAIVVVLAEAGAGTDGARLAELKELAAGLHAALRPILGRE